MKGVCVSAEVAASPGSMSTVSKGAGADDEEEGLVEVRSYYPLAGGGAEEREEEEELELGLSLGAKKLTGFGGSKATPRREHCRILTAEDLPLMASRGSPLSSSSSVASSSGERGGGAGTKRAADSVEPNVVGSATPTSQVAVGWPPIKAYRVNSLVNNPSKANNSNSATVTHKKSNHNISNNVVKEGTGPNEEEKKGGHVGSSLLVKVNMDGDPIGRKVDLNAHFSYEKLALTLEAMFHKPTAAVSDSIYGTRGLKLLDGSSGFVLTYEDRDGDWMLVGDVPWGMFLSAVKRLRIMRTTDATGLAPGFRSTSKILVGDLRSRAA